jgi:hypothetical protein
VKWQARDSRLKLQNDVRTTLLQGLGGLAVLVGAVFTYKQLQNNRSQLEFNRVGLKHAVPGGRGGRARGGPRQRAPADTC